MTLYAFSRENWARSDDEVRGLFGLLEQAIRSETAELREQGVRIRLLGRLEELPDDTRRSIGEALEETAGGTRLLLNVAFNYAGRTELVDAVRRLAASGIAPEAIDEDDDLGGAVHGRPAGPRSRHPDRRRAAALELPHLAVGLRGVLHDGGPLAGLRRGRLRRGAPRVRPTDPPVRALTTTTAPRPRRPRSGSGRSALRSSSRRCSSSSSSAGRGSSRSSRSRSASPASRSSGCSARRAIRRSRCWASRWRSASSSTAAIPTNLDGSGLILVAIGTILAAVGVVRRSAIRATGCRPGSRPCSGRCTSSLLGFVVRLGVAAPEPPTSAPLAFLGGERGWILLLVLGVWSYDTGAYFIGKRFGRREVPHPHLAVEDLRRADRRAGRLDDRRDGDGGAPRRVAADRARPRAAAGARRPGRRPRRIRC